MAVVAEYQSLPLTKLHESPLNPRRHFNAAALAELAASIKAHGVLTPLLVRPNGQGFEIAAGHRRYRAAKLADVAELPAVVRQMSDAQLLEILVVENDQREDVHPLEQAAGYKALMLLDGYDAKRIADRIGRSEKWVYDRVKLLALTPLAQQLFLAGKMSAGHAILIARLTKEQQERIVGMNDDSYDERHLALFQSEQSGEDLWDLTPAEQKEERKKDPLARYKGYKPVSVRELDGWINEHVRLDPTKVDPFLFPEVVAAVESAPKDLVPLTREGFIQNEARDGNVRTWGPRAWKEVDPKKPCKYTQAGIIVVGQGRGDVLQVCLSSHRDGCAIHWSKEKAEAAKNAKMRAQGTSTRRVDNTYEKQQERRKAEEARQEVVQARYKAAGPAIVTAIAAAVDKAPLARIGKEVMEYVAPDRHTRPLVKLEDLHQAGKTADSILRHAALNATLNDLAIYRIEEELTRAGKTWGVDVKAILDKEAPAAKPEKPAQTAAKATPKKKAAKR